jgi:ABC-2 type transport system permease protein
MLKRETIIGAVWILILVLFSAALAPGMSSMFDVESRQTFAATFDNPVMIAMMGPVYGANNYTEGAMYSNMMLLWVIITVAVMNIFLVSRHTRADEEKGRAEVVRSLPVGRLANLNATMVTALIENVILGLLMGLGLAATGVQNMGFAGSMLFGAVICFSGLVFAAITALFCQLSSSKGGATGLSFLILGVFYMIRAAGDMQGNEIISCFSPLGLSQRSQVYVENHWWPIFILLVECLVISAIAYKLNSIRDLDQGFIPARPGKREASSFLRSPFGLAFRLLRNTIIIWIIVMFVLGASYGSIIGDINKFVGESPEYLQIIGVPADYAATLSGAAKEAMVQKYFMSFVSSMMALVSLIPLLMAAVKPRNEEKNNRAEHVLSRVVSRIKYMSGYTILAYVMSVLIPLATAFGIYSSTASLTVDANPFTLGMLLEANLAYLPALWVMIGVAVLLIGLMPKASGAIWGYFGFVLFASLTGQLIGLPEWLLSLSPIKHISQVLLVDVNFTPLIILTVIAAVLTAIGFIFYRKRDVVTA